VFSQHINRLKKRMDGFARQKTFHMPWSIVLNPIELASSLALLESQTKVIHTPRISIGDKVTLFDVREKEVITLTITSSRNSAPEKGFISCLSPLGRELLGHIAGDVVEIKIFFRTEIFRVVRVEKL
jgi:transcription elongation factor GreA